MTEDLEFTLLRLAEESRPLHSLNLAALSDMSRSQVPLFQETWAVLSVERRRDLLRELVDQAEANVQFNFWTVLRILITDEDPEVRKLAIEGLWEDNRITLLNPLVTLLARDPVVDVRAAAAVSLGRFVLLGELGEISESSAQEAMDALRAAWSRPNEVTEVRRRALEGLAYCSTINVHELISTAYYDEEAAMRQSAVFAMGRSADRRWSRPVLEELHSPDAPMRFEAATAAGELGLVAAVRPLVRLLDDADSSVREAAALSLGQIGGPDARRALQACAAGDDERLAEAAEEALQELAFNSGDAGAPLYDFRTASPGVDEDGDDEYDDSESGDGDEFMSEFGEEAYDEDEDDYDGDGDVYDDEDDELDWEDDKAEEGWD